VEDPSSSLERRAGLSATSATGAGLRRGSLRELRENYRTTSIGPGSLRAPLRPRFAASMSGPVSARESLSGSGDTVLVLADPDAVLVDELPAEVAGESD
jgi:hypothetical protein